METIYRDYGIIKPVGIDPPAQSDKAINLEHYRLVYLATHEGKNLLPFMTRSFISFTYGGKPIESFDLIASITNNRLNKNGYAAFNDIVTTYDNLDGQYYWNTHYSTNSLTFILATDGIEQKTLDEFLFWFHAGEAKELILAEHPNRAIMARVANPPELSLLPFEHDVEITISSVTYKTKTTLYKGEITLTLTMDEPHWYAVKNILGERDDANNRYIDYYTDANNVRTSIFASKDALKILYEDGIPLGSMIDNNMLLGDGTYANVESNTNSCTWSLSESSIVWTNGEPSGEGARIYGTISNSAYAENSRLVLATEGSVVLTIDSDSETEQTLNTDVASSFVSDKREYLPGLYNAIIAGAIVDVTGKGISSLANGQAGYFYYAGTAPSPTRLTFTLVPTVSEGYIDAPANTYKKTDGNPYNFIKIVSLTELELRFTTPNLLTSYNKVVEIFKKKIGQSYTYENVSDEIRDNVRHPAVRAWAIKCINPNNETSPVIINMRLEDILPEMQRFLMEDVSAGLFFPMTFTIDSKTGSAIGEFKYRSAKTGEIVEVTENVGDMLYSNYLIIRDRNYPSSDGKILAWRDTEEGRKYSHKITHNVRSNLRDLQIYYRNMYL